MIGRRDMLGAGVFAAAASLASGGALLARSLADPPPRERMRYLEAVPARFGRWSQAPVQGDAVDPVVVDEAFAQALTTYDLIVERDYLGEGARVMLNLAYMRMIEQEAKFHRPEFCYATQGFHVRQLGGIEVPVGARQIPAARFIADRAERREVVCYWTRIGDAVARGSMAQRAAIFRTNLGLRLPDGVLLRASTILPSDDSLDPNGATHLLSRFLSSLVRASGPPVRGMLLGRA